VARMRLATALKGAVATRRRTPGDLSLIGANWLARLELVPTFSPLPTVERPRAATGLGGLAAGAVPQAVRASHGYQPQFPSEEPPALRMSRPGDFFRCDYWTTERRRGVAPVATTANK
jgi:hypothetical protein